MATCHFCWTLDRREPDRRPLPTHPAPCHQDARLTWIPAQAKVTTDSHWALAQPFLDLLDGDLAFPDPSRSGATH